MSELTDRMRTCAAYLRNIDKSEPSFGLIHAARDATDLLLETATELEKEPEYLGEPIEPPPPELKIDRTPVKWWVNNRANTEAHVTKRLDELLEKPRQDRRLRDHKPLGSGVGPPERTSEETMATTYQGKPVTVVRQARQDDDGYEDGEDQIVIKLEDGTHQVVARADVQDAGQQGQGGQGQRQPR